jgi:hypothetical protein
LRPRAAADAGSYAEVAQARDQSEALVIRSLLDAHGIRALLRTHVAPSVHPFTVGHQGEVRILVPAASAVEARRLLARAGRRREAP